MSQGTLHPPKARLVLRVGITGHRPDKLGSDTEVVGAKVRAVLTAIKDNLAAVHVEARKLSCYNTEPPLMRIISSLAEGADQIAAKEAVAPCSELQVVLPFAADEYERDFETEASKEEFRALIHRATTVMTLDGARTSKATEDKSYRAAGVMMLRQCDVVIAVWDGKRPVSTAGTGAIADDALRLGLPVVWINTHHPAAVPVLLTEINHSANSKPKHGMQQLPNLSDRLRALLLPPGEGGDEGAVKDEEARNKSSHKELPWRTYFEERWPRWSQLGWAYTVFVALFAWERPRPRLKMPRQDQRLANEKREGFTHGRLAEHYIWADQLADKYGAAHRGGYVLGFSLAPVAVTLAIIGFACPFAHAHELFLVIAELLVIVAILVLVVCAKRRRWHARWLEYRFLAEQLRQMRMLAPLGRVPRSMQAPAHHAFASPASSLASWQFRAAVREAGLAAETLDHDRRGTLKADSVLPLICDQAAYHRLVEQRHNRVAEGLHVTHIVLFGMTFIVVLLHLAHELGHFFACWLPSVTSVLAAVFPAFGASFAARATQGEFHRLAERSEAMAGRLREIAVRIDALPDPSVSELGDEAEEAANLMLAEVLDWRVMLLARPAQLPA
ncbi:MAG: hypothetical protein WAS73_09695 [Defluviicoccus sp.]